MSFSGRFRPFTVGLLGCMGFAGRTFAQGCVSCYTTAAAGGPQTAHALRSGILVLLFPPVVIFGAIFFTVQRWRAREAKVMPPPPVSRIGD